MSTNFHLAPPAKMVDGLMAVPMDIQTIAATLLFDATSTSATADATISYTVGPVSGHPCFDLRQTIDQAWLDGVPIATTLLQPHNFGGGTLAELRIIEALQAAGSVHTLRVQYQLGTPLAQNPPAIVWSPGPRLTFRLGMSDLNAGRYLEAWLPANLVFDQFTINLNIELTGTMAGHTVITNGQSTPNGFNRWMVSFPAYFSAFSPLLEIRATDTLESLFDNVLLPVSGVNVTVEAWKLASGSASLVTQVNNIKSFLVDNENSYGSYVHGNRFVAFFTSEGGGMEYEGATTTGTGALRHETFHSWFARGVKPAGQADGWWDEAFTKFHDDGADDAIPFDFSNTPVTVCSLNPFQRTTPNNSYTDGNVFWKGMASLLGTATLNSLMREFYNKFKRGPVSTQMLEEFLLSRSGNENVVDAFHRFIYGFGNPSSAPDLWIRDDPAHTGDNQWDGVFWDSPDLWIRNEDDNGTVHQPPEYGQDNWFHARVRNRSSVTARHFVVTFHARSFAGTQFTYPNDFLPCISAKASFEIGPGETKIVKAKWPRTAVPPAGTHSCLLASVIARFDHPVANRHVWEHNNLAQKNLTVVDLQPNWFIIIPVVISNYFRSYHSRFDLEVWRDKTLPEYPAGVIHHSKEMFRRYKCRRIEPLQPNLENAGTAEGSQLLDCGGIISANGKLSGTMLTSQTPELIRQRFPKAFLFPFKNGKKEKIPIEMTLHSQISVGFKVTVPENAKKGSSFKTHFVQRDSKTRQVLGGITIKINVI